VIVSNHGGRAVDSTPAPIEVLPRIVDAVGERLTVIVDSGFRRGADVVKGLALGAKAVLIGRATLYGTAVAGQAGAARAIEIYRDEIDRLFALIGCAGVAELDRSFLVMPPGFASTAIPAAVPFKPRALP
jgi:isopentenyl diphosphate isomerase/L-lactate dehydrogenase-like FMN-dependent dehydrogenase